MWMALYSHLKHNWKTKMHEALYITPKGFIFPRLNVPRLVDTQKKNEQTSRKKKVKRKIIEFLMVQLCFLFVNIWENHSFIFWMGKGNWNRWSITRSIKQEIYALHIHLEAIRLISFFPLLWLHWKFLAIKQLKSNYQSIYLWYQRQPAFIRERLLHFPSLENTNLEATFTLKTVT